MADDAFSEALDNAQDTMGETEPVSSDVPDAGVSAPDTGDVEAPPQAPVSDGGTTPWYNDISQLNYGDNPVQAVDEYIRTTFQPRMTQLEQEAKTWSEMFGGNVENAEASASLLQTLQDPEGQLSVFQQLAEHLGYEIEGVDGLNEGEGQESGEVVQQPESVLPEEYQTLLDEIREEREQQYQQQQLDAYLQDVQTRHNLGDGFDSDLYTELFATTNGDEDRALSLYTQVMAGRVAQATPPAAAPATPPPPKVLSSSTGKAPTPVAEPEEPLTIDEALHRFMQQDGGSHTT